MFLSRKLLPAMIIAAITQTSLADTPAVPTQIQSQSGNGDSGAKATIEETVIYGVRKRLYDAGALLDVIQKTEVVDEDLMKDMQAVNLTQAIEKSPGVRVSNECSMCGVKRVMLNGMRGEHSTILTDGIPLHTMMAGYYAVDALATTGISRIEVARGAGASLLAPEAIGGTINVISKEPEQSDFELNASMEDNDSYFVGMMASYVSDDDRTRASFVLQDDSHEQMDNDDNGVSEAPLQENTSYVGRISHDFTERDNLVVRVAYTDSEIFGGPHDESMGSVLSTYDGIESEELFVNNDVRNTFIGKPWETTEWIATERSELSANWLHEFSENYNAAFTVAWSEHKQDSFYEGFDYKATDELLYLDQRNNLILNDAHILTFGIDMRDEQMRSDSLAGEESLDYVEDSFDYQVVGIYLQDTWTIFSDLELSLALRLDSVEADFVAPEKIGTEIDETVIAPRADLRYSHNDGWTSRVAIGRGYRAPLSFFETDHGILDAGDGFAIDVDTLEQSLSATYALSFEGETLNSTLSLAYTEVEDLAGLDETETGVPLLTQMDEAASVFSADISLGYSVNENLTLAATAEMYDYDNVFRDSFAIAPVEERALFSADYDSDAWSFFASASWVDSRNLAEYGYEGFNTQDLSVAKSTKAESYWTVDLKVAYNVNESLSVYVGSNNITDYTQVNDSESPLFWDGEGAYDVAYIYGPLRGREFYLGFDWSL